MNHPFFHDKVQIFAHRGNSRYFPENTIPAFTSAADLKVDCMETDIHLTIDGTCVIWHDDTLENLTGDQARICSKTLKELKSLDAGRNFSPDNGKTFPFRNTGIKMATLEEVLETLPKMKFNIDLKDNNRKLVREFVRIVRKHKAEGRILGASFHHENILQLRELIPELVTSFSEKEARGIVVSQKTGFLRFKKNFPAEALQVPEYLKGLKIVTPGLLKTLHAHNIFIHVWTVNNSTDMKRLFTMGVDGIFTDDPLLLIQTMKGEN